MIRYGLSLAKKLYSMENTLLSNTFNHFAFVTFVSNLYKIVLLLMYFVNENFWFSNYYFFNKTRNLSLYKERMREG